MIKRIMLFTHDGCPAFFEDYLRNPDLPMPNLMYFDNLKLELFTKIDNSMYPNPLQYTDGLVCFPTTCGVFTTNHVNIRKVDTSKKWYIEDYDNAQSISYLEEFVDINKEENFVEYHYDYKLHSI